MGICRSFPSTKWYAVSTGAGSYRTHARPGAGASSSMTAFILWMWPVPPDQRPPLRPRRFVPSPGQPPGVLDQPVVDKKQRNLSDAKQVLSIVTSTEL